MNYLLNHQPSSRPNVNAERQFGAIISHNMSFPPLQGISQRNIAKLLDENHLTNGFKSFRALSSVFRRFEVAWNTLQ